MFSNLVESGSHAADFKRKGSFFFATLAFYGLLLAVAGVGSIYAYNVSLDDGNEYEFLGLVRFTPHETRSSEPVKRDEPKQSAGASGRSQQFAVRPEISINTPYRGDQIARPETREVGARTAVVLGNFTSDPKVTGGVAGPNNSILGNSPGARTRDTGPLVEELEGGEPPAIAKPTPAPTPKPNRQTLQLSTGVLTGKAISKPAPVYPAIGKQARVQGAVPVQILVDEEGRVVSAKATGGHPLLQAAAVQAALKARFTPTLLSGQPVKVTGIITYNFLLQ